MSFRPFDLRKGVANKRLSRFNTSFGTDPVLAKETAWFRFGAKPGCRTLYLGSGGNDANNGLTHATRKATIPGLATLLATGHTPGDIVMIAGKASYLDDGTAYAAGHTLFGVPGFSAQYPTAFICYDPDDDTNVEKYGRLWGEDRPHIQMTSLNGYFSNLVDLASDSYAFQGLIWEGDISRLAIKFNGRHDNICFQNCSERGVSITIDNAGSARGRSQNICRTMCSSNGMWDAIAGNTSSLYCHLMDGVWAQGCIDIHGGWRMGYHRDTAQANGAPNVFGHANYFSAYNINGHYDFSIYGDSASDGLGLRGSADANCIVQIDDPIVGALTGFSSSSNFLVEAPDGRVVRLRDHAVMGGGSISASLPNGGGIGILNATRGTLIENAAYGDNPRYGASPSLNYLINPASVSVNQIDQYITLRSISSYNWSPWAEVAFGPAAGEITKLHIDWHDVMLDPNSVGGAVPQSVALHGTNIQYHSGAVTFPNALTRAQLYTRLGYSCRNELFNDLLCYPHLAIQCSKVINTIWLRSLNREPMTYVATEEWPDFSSLPAPPLFYPVTLNALTLSSPLVSGAANSGTIPGSTPGSKITMTGQPTGFVLDALAHTWTYDGTAFAPGSLALTEHCDGTANDGRVSNISYG